MAATSGYGFAIDDSRDTTAPLPLLRFSDRGVESLRLPGARTSALSPQLLTANSRDLYAATQVIHRLVRGRDRLWRIDPTGFTVTKSVTFPSMPIVLAASNRDLYVATSTSVYWLDGQDLRTLGEFTVPGARPPPIGTQRFFGLATVGSHVYAAYGNALHARLLGFTSRLTLQTSRRIPAGQGTVLYGNTCGGWVLTWQGHAYPITDGRLATPVDVPDAAGRDVNGAMTCRGLLLDVFRGTQETLELITRTHGITATQPLTAGGGGGLNVDSSTDAVWRGGRLVERMTT